LACSSLHTAGFRVRRIGVVFYVSGTKQFNV
jgi:hypothetical protein